VSETVSERERDGGWRSVRMMDARVGEMPGASAQYDKSVILNHRYRCKAPLGSQAVAVIALPGVICGLTMSFTSCTVELYSCNRLATLVARWP
jgi:hypothetical protein